MKPTKDEVLISRDANDTVNGVRRTGRVFVTGPHFGIAYSSTESRDLASRFDRSEAERLLSDGKWMNSDPRLEDAP